MLAIWPLVPLPFLNPVCTYESSQFMYYWSLAWRILSIRLLACEMSTVVWYLEHSLVLPFFGIGMKTDLFQSCGHWLLSFPNLLAYWVQYFHSIIFRIWNSSTGIPSVPLVLFIVMLPKTHLTSHSRMLVLDEWSHHHGYLGHEDLYCILLLCIPATSS